MKKSLGFCHNNREQRSDPGVQIPSPGLKGSRGQETGFYLGQSIDVSEVSLLGLKSRVEIGMD